MTPREEVQGLTCLHVATKPSHVKQLGPEELDTSVHVWNQDWHMRSGLRYKKKEDDGWGGSWKDVGTSTKGGNWGGCLEKGKSNTQMDQRKATCLVELGVIGRRESKGISIRLDRYTTKMHAELMGIEAATQLAKWEACRRRIPICGLLSSEVWIPEHNGINDIELADDLSKLWARQTLWASNQL